MMSGMAGVRRDCRMPPRSQRRVQRRQRCARSWCAGSATGPPSRWPTKVAAAAFPPRPHPKHRAALVRSKRATVTRHAIASPPAPTAVRGTCSPCKCCSAMPQSRPRNATSRSTIQRCGRRWSQRSATSQSPHSPAPPPSTTTSPSDWCSPPSSACPSIRVICTNSGTRRRGTRLQRRAGFLGVVPGLLVDARRRR
jgi:hypothetical protein